MRVEGISTVLPTPDVAEAARLWTELLGVAPTFVDGARWAQFDVGGRRIALAGTDRVSDQAGVMIKVDALEEARARAQALGLAPGAIEEGPHEMRFAATAPGGWALVFYAPKTPPRA